MSFLRIIALPFAVLADAGNSMVGGFEPSRVRQLLNDEKEERMVKALADAFVKASKEPPHDDR